MNSDIINRQYGDRSLDPPDVYDAEPCEHSVDTDTIEFDSYTFGFVTMIAECKHCECNLIIKTDETDWKEAK